MFITDLKCEYLRQPLAVNVARPTLSWDLQSPYRCQEQSAYQIIVSSTRNLVEANHGDLWDSGKVESSRSEGIVFTGKKLLAFQCCYWVVRVWDQYGQVSLFSEPEWWEMGILDPAEWTAYWLKACEANGPLFRGDYEVQGPIKKARAYICGLGYYELYVNGQKVGDHVLDPAQTDFEKRALYVPYDITELLQNGRNAVGVCLGNGWFNQSIPFLTGPPNNICLQDMSYGEPCFSLLLRVEYLDGLIETGFSDDTWKFWPGPIVKDNVYLGEHYDARREIPNWSSVEFDYSSWHSAEVIHSPTKFLQPQNMPPIRRISTRSPIKLNSPASSVHVFDFGQNFAGWARIKVKGEPGGKVEIRFAEEVTPDGRIATDSTGTFHLKGFQEDSYTCKGGDVETWEPRFTYHGFRYAEVKSCCNCSLEEIEGVVVHSDVESSGQFVCSDPMLNRIHRAAVWSLVSNLHGVPTDCPHREKCGWLGDVHIYAEMAIYNFNMHTFLSKYLEDIQTSSCDGIPGQIAPGKRQFGYAPPDWGTAIVQIPWYLYLYYGDIESLRKHYDAMKAWTNYLTSMAKDFVIDQGFGDWCEPGSVKPIHTPVGLTSTGYFYLDAIIMFKTASILGHDQEASAWKELSSRIKESFNGHFLDKHHNTYGSQTGDSFALYLGLVPKEREGAVTLNLAKDVLENDFHHTGGITGLRHLHWTLCHFGYADVALKLLHQTTYPSLGHLFSLGATTFWETWGEKDIDDKIGARSHNHPMQAGLDAFFYQTVLGIYPSEEQPGFKHTLLRPGMFKGLKSARGYYQSLYGKIRSCWTKEGQFLNWKVELPANTSATAIIPCTNVRGVLEGERPLDQAEGIEVLRVGTTELECSLRSGKYNFRTIIH